MVQDNKKCFERKIGSSYDGIYQTNIWVYFLDDKNTNSDKSSDNKNSKEGSIYPYGRKYERLNDVIKQYWFYTDKLNLNQYRWNVKPLGFLAENENIIVCAAYTYDEKNREHIFLGSWSIDISSGEVNLLSTSASDNFEISTNGLVINKRLP